MEHRRHAALHRKVQTTATAPQNSRVSPGRKEPAMFDNMDANGLGSNWRKSLLWVAAVFLLATAGIGGWQWHLHHAKNTHAIIASTSTSPSKAPTTTKPAPPTKSADEKTQKFHEGWYQLQRGDQLLRISLRAYGHLNLKPLLLANPGLPSDLRKIQAGWWIWIPKKQGPYDGWKQHDGHERTDGTTAAQHDHAAHAADRAAKAPAPAVKAVASHPNSSRILDAMKKSAAASAASLAVVDVPVNSPEIDDPPLVAMTGMAFAMTTVTAAGPSTIVPKATTTDTAAPAMSTPSTGSPSSPVMQRKPLPGDRAERRGNGKSPKGYAFVLPKGTEALPGRPLETRVFLFQPEEKIAVSQHRIGNSRIKVTHGRYVLYVPLRQLPQQNFNLVVTGITDPVNGEAFRESAIPVYDHFPGSHPLARALFGFGQDAGPGALAYLALGPVAGASAFAATTLINLAKDHHQAVSAKNEEAAKDAAIDANLALERGESHSVLASATKGPDPLEGSQR